MLAGEPFTDEPACVCPVIAEFLRTYNDLVDSDRRQDLLPYASLVVGTREGAEAERRRANACLDWRLARCGTRRPRLRRFLWMIAPSTASRDIEIAHRTARWAAASAQRHPFALQLVESLTGRSPLQVERVEPRERPPHAEHDADGVLARS